MKQLTVAQYLTEERIAKAFANTNFGDDTLAYRHRVVIQACWKICIGYAIGHTMRMVLYELDLIMLSNGTINAAGKRLLRAAWTTNPYSENTPTCRS